MVRGNRGHKRDSHTPKASRAERLVHLYMDVALNLPKQFCGEKNLRESKGVQETEGKCVCDLRPIKAHDRLTSIACISLTPR